MKVAIFASSFWPNAGGVEELVRQLGHEYVRQGGGAIVLTSRWPRSLPGRETYQGIPVYRLPMRIPESSLKSQLSYHLTNGWSRWAILDILRRHRVDLIHVQCVSSSGYYALQAKRAMGLPLVVTAQGERTMDASGLYQRSAFINQTLRDLLAEADHITGCSQHTLDDIEQWWGEPLGARASVVYNGIRTDDFARSTPFVHPRPYILGIGRLVQQKGFDVLIKAFAMAGLPSHDLLIAGDGPIRKELGAFAEKLGVGDRVRFLGVTDRTTSASLFTGCAFFALPSRCEPLGIVNLEAMAAGKAVVASRVGGVPEIVADGETGILVRPECPDTLAAALVRLGSEPELCSQFGKAGRARVQEFRWEHIARRYAEIYEAAIQLQKHQRTHLCLPMLTTAVAAKSKYS